MVCSAPLMSILVDVIPMGLEEVEVMQYEAVPQGVDWDEWSWGWMMMGG